MATAPGFYKGQMVEPRGTRVFGVRTATASEKDTWYKDRYAEAPHDCAGESWIHDGITSVQLTPGTRYTVVRGRCSARTGWGNPSAGYCEVAAPDGSRCLVDRRDMIVVGGTK